MADSKLIKLLFDEAHRCECITHVLEFAKRHKYGKKLGVKLTRRALIEILRDRSYRETAVQGSIFDMIQQKLDIDRERGIGLIKAKKKGLSWREAVVELHLGDLEDSEYERLRRMYLKK